MAAEKFICMQTKEKLDKNTEKIRSDEELAPKPSAFQSVYGGKLSEAVDGVDKTSYLPLWKREEDWSRNVSRNCFWDRYR